MKQRLGARTETVIALLTRLRGDAGWQSRKLTPVVITVLGLASDFLTPWYDVLAWLMPAAVVLAFSGVWFWRRAHSKGQSGRRAASTALYGLMSSGILLPIFTLNVAAGGDTGVMAQAVPSLEKAQEAITVRLDRIERALDVLTGAVEDQTGAVENVQQTMERSYAVEVLDRAMENRNGSSQGQVEAVQSLLALGYDFVETDLSGISFRRGRFDGGDFSGGDKKLADFSNASLRRTVFDRSNMAFARLHNADFSDASLEGVEASFADAREAVFAGASLRNAEFYGADLSGANLSGADLRGASLAYADLRGADFRGADLTGAYLTGALLSGADFTGTIFRETNMLAAVGDMALFDVAQRKGFCRHAISDGRLAFRVIEERSPPYRAGSRYENLISGWEQRQKPYPFSLMQSLTDKSFPPCETPSDARAQFNASYPLSYRVQLDESLLDIGDRRAEVSRSFIAAMRVRDTAHTAGPMVVGDSAYRQTWLDEMKAVSAAPHGPLYWTDDNLLLLMLRQGSFKPDDIRWDRAAKRRHSIEEYAVPDIEQKTGWARFFPADSTYPDLPPETTDLFRSWTENRVKHVAQDFQLKVDMVLRTDADGQQVLLWTGGLPGIRRNSWSSRVSSALEELGTEKDSALVVDVRHDALDRVSVVFVLDRPYRELGFVVPLDLGLTRAPSGTEIKIRITDVVRKGRVLFLKLRATRFRLLNKDGNIALQTPVGSFPGLY